MPERALVHAEDGDEMRNILDRSATCLTVVVQSKSVREQIELDDPALAWLPENAPETQSRATGVTVGSAYSVMRNIVNMLIGTVIAMLVQAACFKGSARVVFALVRARQFGWTDNLVTRHDWPAHEHREITP